MYRDWIILFVSFLLLAFIVYVAHHEADPRSDATLPQTGVQLFVNKGCYGCHKKYSSVGCPTLVGFSERSLIAGRVPNTPDNLRKWLKNPASIKRGSRMPNLGLTDQEVEVLIIYIQSL